MLTIAGEAHVQNGTHPNPLPKTLTGPDLKRFGLVQTCRGMRGFTDFCLCSIRAKFAPVSAHLSICRNFTTALPGPRHRVATGCHGIERTGPHRPVCMYRLVCRGDRDRCPETRAEEGLRDVDRNRFNGPGAHCTAHRNHSVPKILTLSARNSVTLISTNPRHTRDQQPEAPEKPHLDDKNGIPTDAEALPKNLTVTAAASKMSMTSDTYVRQVFRCVRRPSPEKPHLYGVRADATAVCRFPKNLTCAKKWHRENQISASPGGLFSEFAPLRIPESLTFDQFLSK